MSEAAKELCAVSHNFMKFLESKMHFTEKPEDNLKLKLEAKNTGLLASKAWPEIRKFRNFGKKGGGGALHAILETEGGEGRKEASVLQNTFLQCISYKVLPSKFPTKRAALNEVSVTLLSHSPSRVFTEDLEKFQLTLKLVLFLLCKSTSLKLLFGCEN